MSRLSIIMPVLNAGDAVTAMLDPLAPLRALGVEVVVVDGGSRDATIQRARLRADIVISAPPGQASQMNAGAAKATGDVLLFLPVGTRLPDAAEHLVLDGLARSGRAWGRFDVYIEGRSPLLAVAAFVMNMRSRMTGIATSDQAIFVERELFEAEGGFPPIALLEDVALTRRLKRVTRPLCIARRVTISGARWETQGVLRTMLQLARLRLAYYFGADPAALAKRYGYGG
jgi:rSAM/selenodomain-associated transferase 2